MGRESEGEGASLGKLSARVSRGWQPLGVPRPDRTRARARAGGLGATSCSVSKPIQIDGFSMSPSLRPPPARLPALFGTARRNQVARTEGSSLLHLLSCSSCARSVRDYRTCPVWQLGTGFSAARVFGVRDCGYALIPLFPRFVTGHSGNELGTSVDEAKSWARLCGNCRMQRVNREFAGSGS